MKKILVILLSVLMILPFAVSCGQTADPEDTSSAVAATSGSTDNTEVTAADTEIKLNIPDSVKFNGTTVRILNWNSERAEFEIESENGETINDALWKKNARTEEQLGITFEWTTEKGEFGNQANFVQVCANSISAGGDEVYDIFAGYSLTAATIMLQGLSQDLKKFDVIDLSLPWWPESLTTQATIGGKMYYISGDISSNVLHMMYCCVFNKGLLEEVHGKDVNMYTLVENGEWTLDKLIELSKGVYRDDNGDNIVNYGDRFGFQSIDLHFDCFYNGSGLKNLEVNANNEIVISDDYLSQKTIDLSEKLCKFLHESGDAYGQGTNSTGSSISAFANEQALFVVDRSYCTTFAAMKDTSVSFGILPVPKYDKEQEKYYTCMAFPYTLYSMSAAAPHAEAAAATLETLAYYSYSLVTPAIFEIAMKSKYAKEYDDARMFDIIRENVYFDLGRIFTTPCANFTYISFRECIRYNQGAGWATTGTAAAKQLKSKLKTINTNLGKLGD